MRSQYALTVCTHSMHSQHALTACAPQHALALRNDSMHWIGSAHGLAQPSWASALPATKAASATAALALTNRQLSAHRQQTLIHTSAAVNCSVSFCRISFDSFSRSSTYTHQCGKSAAQCSAVRCECSMERCECSEGTCLDLERASARV